MLYEEWQKEAQAHQDITELRHHHIINCIAAISRGFENFLMLEWADGGNLRQFWNKYKPRLTTTLVQDTIYQLYGLADALEKIHQKGYRHGDMKPENILRMSAQAKQLGSSEINIGTLKINDMGLAETHENATELPKT